MWRRTPPGSSSFGTDSTLKIPETRQRDKQTEEGSHRDRRGQEEAGAGSLDGKHTQDLAACLWNGRVDLRST